MQTYRVVLNNDRAVEVEANAVSEADGRVRFTSPGQGTVASFAKGEWSHYYQPSKVKLIEPDPPAIA